MLRVVENLNVVSEALERSGNVMQTFGKACADDARVLHIHSRQHNPKRAFGKMV